MHGNKGKTSHFKGKKRSPFTEEHRKKLSESHKGYIIKNRFDWKGKKRSVEACKNMSLAQKGKLHLNQRGDRNGSWKGDDVGYFGLHIWIRKYLGKPTKCEFCGKDGLTGKQIHWANKDHTYKRNLTDWIRLCSSCHKQYDIAHNFK